MEEALAVNKDKETVDIIYPHNSQGPCNRSLWRLVSVPRERKLILASFTLQEQSSDKHIKRQFLTRFLTSPKTGLLKVYASTFIDPANHVFS